jgi:signal transduction histidine kinase
VIETGYMRDRSCVPGLQADDRQLVADGIDRPANSQVRTWLARPLVFIRQVLEEARHKRHKMCGRRPSQSACAELAEAFSLVPDEGASSEPPKFRVSCGGWRRPLHPLVREEVYRIGREAITNAFRHANARNIEMEVNYCSNALRLVVRDDGCGFSAQLLVPGRSRHWGLPGMRETAEGIGARLRLWSAPRRGTWLELTVPGRIAFYEPEWRSRSGRSLRNFWRPKKMNGHDPSEF